MPKFDTKKSKVKLWIGTAGTQKNGIWFNFLTEQKLSENVIISRMTKRILDERYNRIFITAKFYNNITGKLINSIEGRSDSSDKNHANIKLWVGFPDMSSNETWYSRLSENRLDNDEIIKVMTDRILRDRCRYQFTRAMFFNNKSGMFLKMIEGNIIKK